MCTSSNRQTTQTASAPWPPEMTGKKKKQQQPEPNRIKCEGRKWTKGRRKEKPAGRKRHAETDGRRQQDKKPHHLLLYLLDLISGVNNIGQKYKMKNTRQKGKKKKTKDKKQWVTLQHKNTVQSMRLAQQMGVGAVTRLTNGNCVPCIDYSIPLVMHFVPLLLRTAIITFHMIYEEIISAFPVSMALHALLAMKGGKFSISCPP